MEIRHLNVRIEALGTFQYFYSREGQRRAICRYSRPAHNGWSLTITEWKAFYLSRPNLHHYLSRYRSSSPFSIRPAMHVEHNSSLWMSSLRRIRSCCALGIARPARDKVDEKEIESSLSGIHHMLDNTLQLKQMCISCIWLGDRKANWCVPSN